MDVFANVPLAFYLQFQKKYNLEVGRLLRARDIVQRGEIRLLPNGNFAVRSHTKGAPPEYQVNPRFESCQCHDANMQWNNGVLVKEAQVCKHLSAFLLVREMDLDLESLAFALMREQAIETQEPRLALFRAEYFFRETDSFGIEDALNDTTEREYWGDSPSLFPSPMEIEERERKAREQRDARDRTEWEEEI